MPPARHNLISSICIQFGLFKGQSLAEELGFVRYFHNQPVNVYLHVVGFHFFALMAIIFARLLFSGLDYLLVFLYVAGMTMMDYPFGVVGIVAGIVFGFLDYIAITIMTRYTASYAGLFAVIFGAIGGALQLIGHIFVDRSQPAFRMFEAFFTTPFYLYLYLMFKIGYKPALRQEIISKTALWRGSERVTYGQRIFSEE